MTGDLARLAVERRGSAAVATLTGEVDLSNAATVEDAVTDAVGGVAGVALDLGGLSYLDSAGLGLLSRLAARFGGDGTALRLVVPSAAIVRRAIAVSGLDTAIPVDETVDAALAELSDQPR
ncbi:MAG TPA: STAS domain-containing protein [Mycobacteriales bacterium]|jgi:anti-anti-sigma factor|nr:STAS domain-containing protein [Mycobacteriales bacterium]